MKHVMVVVVVVVVVSGVPGESIPVESEEDVFEVLDYPYKKPSERNV